LLQPTQTTILLLMDYFLFFIYLILFPVLVRYLDKKNIIRIDIRVATVAFMLKVSMACLYGYIFQEYYGGDDTWMYHQQSQDETVFLKTDPLHFLHSLIDPTSYTRYMMTTWWQELEYASLIKLLAILNVLSGGSYYVNAVLFSMISFWGAYFYYSFFTRLYPSSKTLLMLVFFFFIPMVFWTSGIRKDGLIMLFTGMFFLSTYRFFETGNKKMTVAMLFAIMGVALNRNFVALSLIPPAIAWILSKKLNRKPLRVHFFVYSISLVVFFLSAVWGPVNLPGKFVQRQADFMALQGGSYVALDTLDTDPVSFIKILPQALNHVFLRPYPGEGKGVLHLFSALETWFVVLMLLLWLFFPTNPRRGFLQNAVVCALLFFSVSNYLFVGYTIPFLGAIVRYRIVFETILLALAVTQVNWQKLVPERVYK